MNRTLLCLTLLLATGVALAEGPPEAEPVRATGAQEPAKPDTPAARPAGGPVAQPQAEEDAVPGADTGDADGPAPAEAGPKMISGMSILGNQEAPTSLVIVPWKSSVIGDAIGISTMLDDSRQPVDREVFLRALSYYEIRSGKTP